MVQFLNPDFTLAKVQLLQLGVDSIQNHIISFFDEFLNTGELALSNIGRLRREFEDEGGRAAFAETPKSKAKRSASTRGWSHRSSMTSRLFIVIDGD
jgi:hypothetical protein